MNNCIRVLILNTEYIRLRCYLGPHTEYISLGKHMGLHTEYIRLGRYPGCHPEYIQKEEVWSFTVYFAYVTIIVVLYYGSDETVSMKIGFSCLTHISHTSSTGNYYGNVYDDVCYRYEMKRIFKIFYKFLESVEIIWKRIFPQYYVYDVCRRFKCFSIPYCVTRKKLIIIFFQLRRLLFLD